jgi:hypothetical protein
MKTLVLTAGSGAVCSRRRRPRFAIAMKDRSQRNPRSRFLMQVPSTARRRLAAGGSGGPGVYNYIVHRVGLERRFRAAIVRSISSRGRVTKQVMWTCCGIASARSPYGGAVLTKGALLPIVAISLTMSVRCAGIISSRVQIGAAARGREPRRMATAVAEIRLLVGLHGVGRDPRGPIGRAGPAYCPQSTGRAAPQFPDEDWPHDLTAIARNFREREQKRHVSNPTAAECVVTWSRGLPTNDAMCISDIKYTCLIIS